MVDLGGPGVRLAAVFVAGLAALNHGLVEFLVTDLLTQLVSTGSTEYQVLIGVISIAAASTSVTKRMAIGTSSKVYIVR